MGTLNRLLASKQSQAKRTGDFEGFESEIRSIEEEVSNIKRQIEESKQKVEEFRQNAEELVSQMAKNNCRNFI